MVYVGDTGKILSVWISCCSKHSVTALLCIKLINGNSCSNNLPVKTESVQESWQPLHNQQDSNSQHCKQLNSVNKTLCYIILFTVICYALFNTRLSLFNKTSHQSFTQTTRHSAKTQHRGVIFNIRTKGITINRSYNPANALQDKIK